MKTVRLLSFAVGLLVVSACEKSMQAVAAQNPAISSKYANVEIAKMLNAYRAANAHDAIPPTPLQQKFQADFPKASDVEWETANGLYEAEFEIRFRDFKALYDQNGELLMVVEEIHSSALPAIVKNAAQAQYPKYGIEDVHKIRRGTETFYRLEMEKSFSDAEIKLLLKSDGTVVEEKMEY